MSLFQLESSDSSVYSEEEIVLAAVFIAFKAADYIPGTGRVRMHHLLDAFERTGRIKQNILIERVCEIELLILCLSGFDFEPFSLLHINNNIT